MRELKAALFLCVAAVGLYAQGASRSGAWSTYSGDAQGARYSPLTQINTKNVSKLKLAWQYGVAGRRRAGERRSAGARPSRFSCAACSTPRPRGGRSSRWIRRRDGRSGSTSSRRAAPRTAAWRTGPATAGCPRESSREQRTAACSRSTPATGKPVATFGDHGAIDLRAGVADKFPKMPYLMASPGIIYRNLIVTGAQGQEDNPEGPAMDVRAWDVRTGKLVWTFHTIPHPGEPGSETWPKDYWMTAGSPANWGFGSVDAERGSDLPAHRPAGGAVLRRPSRAAESVFLVGRRARCEHRQGALALSADASRRVGLRQRRHARADRRRPERPENSRRRHGGEVGPDVLSRARNRQADLSGRGTAGAGERHPRRGDLADAAVSREAAAAVAAQHHAGRDLHRRTRAREVLPRSRGEDRRHSQSRSVHAVQQQGIPDRVSRAAGRAEFRRRRGRSSRWATSSSTRATSAAWAAWTRRPTGTRSRIGASARSAAAR